MPRGEEKIHLTSNYSPQARSTQPGHTFAIGFSDAFIIRFSGTFIIGFSDTFPIGFGDTFIIAFSETFIIGTRTLEPPSPTLVGVGAVG